MINLKRRPDRLNRFKLLSGLEDTEFELFEAIDGKKLTWNDELQRLFKNNNFESLAGVVGCCLSHFNVWKQIASTENQLHLVFEDDANFEKDWIEKWNLEYFPDLPSSAFVSLLCMNTLQILSL